LISGNAVYYHTAVVTVYQRIRIVCIFAGTIQATAWAQTVDGSDLLKRIRENVMDTVGRLPRYMCSLRIERAQYEPAPGPARNCDGIAAQHHRGRIGRLVETDRVRLDVAIGDANEMYSWVGEDRFDDRDVFDLVRDGALENGGYSLFLASIFGSGAADFIYDGEKQVDGRNQAAFRFRVPTGRSNYVYGNRRGFSVVTGYSGSLYADPNTGDLVRLVIQTSELPEESGACEATTTLDYTRTLLHDSAFLLPRETSLDILQTDGSELRNTTVYSSCHEFQGKSVLTFDAPSADSVTEAPAPKPSPRGFTLPAGTVFKMLFTQAIDPAKAAAGDRIGAKLTAAIIDPATKAVLAPAGADITARIIRIEQFPLGGKSVRMLVKLETVSANGNSRPFSPAMNWVAITPASGAVAFRPTPPTQRTVSFDVLADPNVGTFYFGDAGSNFVIQAGLQSNWMATNRATTQPSSLFAREMLAAHNAVRQSVGVPPLIWSDRLASLAQEWAQTLLTRNELVYRPDLKVGENLFDIRGPAAPTSPSKVVEAWTAESRGYIYRTNKCSLDTGCGHYTQLVWRTTKEVGCAVAKADNREVWVCNYDPRGNWLDTRPY
jgi:pathogenesis-related protein 1